MTSILDVIHKNVPQCVYKVDVGIARTENALQEYEVDMDPEYQRDYVWTQRQQQEFMGSLLLDHNMINPIILNFTGDGTHSPSEIVDGKQRLNAILQWTQGKIHAALPTGEEIKYNDLPEKDIRACKSIIRLQWRWVNLSKKNVISYYLALNSGGTVHTKEDLQKARDMLERMNGPAWKLT